MQMQTYRFEGFSLLLSTQRKISVDLIAFTPTDLYKNENDIKSSNYERGG